MKIKIYSATKGKSKDCKLYKSIYRYTLDDIEFHFEENNTKSLQTNYNNFLSDARSNKIDIALFIHDDVIINTDDFKQRIYANYDRFTVFGLAGATSIKVGIPALWHLMSKRADHLGCVAHGHEDHYQYTSFGPLNKRALVIDGVFMGINVNDLPVDVKFDESYPSKWHYYDLDFCLECNKKGITIGVIDIPIIHNSPGLTNPDEEYYQGEQYFINKWKI